MDGWTHGQRQNYIPPTSSGDKKLWKPESIAIKLPTSALVLYVSRIPPSVPVFSFFLLAVCGLLCLAWYPLVDLDQPFSTIEQNTLFSCCKIYAKAQCLPMWSNCLDHHCYHDRSNTKTDSFRDLHLICNVIAKLANLIMGEKKTSRFAT